MRFKRLFTERRQSHWACFYNEIVSFKILSQCNASSKNVHSYSFMMLVCLSLLVISPEAFGDFSPTGTKMSVTSEEPPTLEPIAGSQNFRINGKKCDRIRPFI